MSNTFTKYTAALTLVAVLFIIWNILGILDSKNYTNSGYNATNSKITRIIEGGAAEKAGLQVGDVIKSTGGIAVTDTKALNQRQRAKVGETRAFVVDRNGEELSIDLTFTGMSDKNRNLNRFGDIMGLLFIVMGFFAHRKHKSSLSFSFAIFAICFGFIFTNGPYIASNGLSIVVNIVSSWIFLFSITALAVFLLKYPPESSFIGNEKKRKMIYAPLIIMAVIITIVQGSQMDRSETLNTVMRLLFGAYIIFFFGTSLITLIRKYRNADADLRKTNGLNLMLIGTLIGLLPILIYFSVRTIAPDMFLPGNEYAFITFIAIPIFFSMALNQQSNNSASE